MKVAQNPMAGVCLFSLWTENAQRHDATEGKILERNMRRNKLIGASKTLVKILRSSLL